jgi:hypothetical protein
MRTGVKRLAWGVGESGGEVGAPTPPPSTAIDTPSHRSQLHLFFAKLSKAQGAFFDFVRLSGWRCVFDPIPSSVAPRFCNDPRARPKSGGRGCTC